MRIAPAAGRPWPRPGRRAGLAWALAAVTVAAVVLGVRALGGAQALLGIDQVATGPTTALQQLAAVLPFGYALGAGMLAALNPCGFALLPAYLGLYLGSPESAATPAPAARVGRALLVAGTMTAAFVLTFGVAGVAVGAVGAATGAALPVIGLTVGLALTGAGAHLLAGGHLSGRLADRVTARLAGPAGSRGVRAYAAYGVAYAAASLGCALPIFLSVVGLASATRDPVRAAGQLALYGVGMGLVVSALTIAAAVVKGVPGGRARAVGGRLAGPATGALLVLTGAYVVAYWLTLGFQ
jgi:cytochrome c biogenesis protein CcdA